MFWVLGHLKAHLPTSFTPTSHYCGIQARTLLLHMLPSSLPVTLHPPPYTRPPTPKPSLCRVTIP